MTDTTGAVQVAGALVRSVRKGARISRERLADTAGVSRTTIVRLECGSGNLGLLTILNIIEALGLDPGDFLEEVGRRIKAARRREEGLQEYRVREE